ncbi:MAG: galactokinase [Anaerolineae bacterium]|nr:galactokinase [Anaerolineae bacterium]MDH7474246.1 galactokinase [Anaerolineae bacterium]
MEEDRVVLLRNRFRQLFGTEAALVVRAPGRVNLIGEHTDYNDGYVLPVAIDRSVLLAASPRPDRWVVVHALDFDQRAEFPLDDIVPDDEHPWSNYQRGVAWVLQSAGFTLPGLNMALTSDVPIGAGLSSSAAVEVATAYTWQVLGKLELDRVRLALLCQRAENEFVGMNCGIMDQFISALGQRDSALLIDCRSLDYELVPIPAHTAIIVADTRVRRELVSSEYNTRRRECEEGVHLLQRYLPGIIALRDVSPTQFAEHQAHLPDGVRQRCRHVICENDRVLRAVAALRADDLVTFGRLMDESHASLRNDYQVSCPELDALVMAAWRVKGVYGSRMTGAGFGGCTVSLVDESAVEAFREHVSAAYQAATGTAPEIHVCRAEAGAGVV